MTASALYPLKLRPTVHVKVWGGRRLADLMQKPLPTSEPVGESWEIHDSAIVVNGPLQGSTLGDLARRYGAELLGGGHDPGAGFPLLAKLIDATDWLSVQVHPNDEQAQRLEGEPRGKTEAWVVLHADLGARLVIGLRPGTTRAQMGEAIRHNRLEDFLVYAEVAAGDVLHIPANTIHALGPGLLIYEIQQASDTTYRLYDWGRLGLDGQPRELHIEKALQVANLAALPEVEQPKQDLLVDGEYFRSWRHELSGDRLAINTGGRFQALTCIAGDVNVAAGGADAITLNQGESGLIPACIAQCVIRGHGVVLRASPP
ncbi:MAG: class I mannose-6-phosphate isomerase [Chloroflexota bacterium]|nr:class I mannose-6-phosphate isomerase [Chloroflexota bacterium]MDE2945939.1 class I mannose-6-phosphate isomerase [Chloroflexota bacterium]